MAAQPAPTTIVEDDDGNAVADLGNEPILAPVTKPSIAGAGTDNFEIVEVDESGKPLGGEPVEPTLADDPTARQQPVIQEPQLDTSGRPLSKGQKRRQQQRAFARQNQEENTRLARENEELRQRLDGLETRVGTVVEPRLGQIDRAMFVERKQQVEGQLARVTSEFDAATRAMREALSQGQEGTDALLAAMEKRDEAVLTRERLKTQKAWFDENEKRLPAIQDQRQAQPQRQQPQRQELNDRGRTYISEFSRGLDWFDSSPRTADQDSRVLQKLDADVLADGYDPNTTGYWEELEARAQRYLPHHFLDEGQQPQAQQQPRQPQQPQQRQQVRGNVTPLRRGPAVPGTADGGGQRQLAKNQVAITPDRKAAMMELGVIAPDGRVQNPERLNRLLKEYHEYDRLHPEGAR